LGHFRSAKVNVNGAGCTAIDCPELRELLGVRPERVDPLPCAQESKPVVLLVPGRSEITGPQARVPAARN
jgi:hypothetical protein